MSEEAVSRYILSKQKLFDRLSLAQCILTDDEINQALSHCDAVAALVHRYRNGNANRDTDANASTSRPFVRPPQIDVPSEYEATLAANLDTSVLEQFTCAVCLRTVNGPYRGKCGHVFCKPCVVGKLYSCPVCRDDWKVHRPVKDTYLEAALNELSKHKKNVDNTK